MVRRLRCNLGNQAKTLQAQQDAGKEKGHTVILLLLTGSGGQGMCDDPTNRARAESQEEGPRSGWRFGLRRAVWDAVGHSRVGHTGAHPWPGEPAGWGRMAQKFLVQMRETLKSTPTPPPPYLAVGGVTGQCSMSGHLMFKIQLKALGGRGRGRDEWGRKEGGRRGTGIGEEGGREGPTVLILMLKLLIPSYAKEKEATNNTQKEK